MKKYNLFLDDIRMVEDTLFYMPKYTHSLYAQNEFIIVRSYEDFTTLIKRKFEYNEFISFVSFDHDLAHEHYQQLHNINYADFQEKTGLDCVKWLCDFCADNKLTFPDYLVHSMNPAGKKNIKNYIEKFKQQISN